MTLRSEQLTIFQLIDPDCTNHCLETIQRVLEQGRVDRIETAFVAKNGDKIMIQGSASCRYENGKHQVTRCVSRTHANFIGKPLSPSERAIKIRKMLALELVRKQICGARLVLFRIDRTLFRENFRIQWCAPAPLLPSDLSGGADFPT